MEINEIIGAEIANVCKENYHVENISYYCKNHYEFFCKRCIKRKENCKILELNAFKDEQKSQIQENIKNLVKFSKIIEEKNDKLKNIYEQIKNSMNKLINDMNLVFSSLIDELINKKNELFSIAKNKFNMQLFENIFHKYENLNNNIKLLINKEEFLKTKLSDKSNINDCTSIKNSINEIENCNSIIRSYTLSIKKNEQILKEEKNKFNISLDKIESCHKNFKINNKETYKIFNNLLETLVFLENKLDKKQIKNTHELNDKNNNYIIKTGNIKTNNYYTSKDIQIKLSEIYDYFKTYSNNFYDDNEEIENQKMGEFLLKVANISILSYNHSNIILKFIYDEFIKFKNKEDEKIITSLDEIKENFSSWVKNNNINIENKILKYLNNLEISYIKEEENNKNFFNKLIKDLSILFFKCELSFPSIQIDFSLTENNFNYEKMFDYVHNKGNKKVNFVFFPSFESNNNYLDNGKQWVFTYTNGKNKTFYFKDIKLEPLIEKNKFYIPKLSDKFELDIEIIPKKYIIPHLNYRIPDKSKKEFIYYFKNNKENKIIKYISDKQVIIEDYLDFIKCDFYLMSKYILSYPKNNIINKDNNIE